jgi:predicted permease
MNPRRLFDVCSLRVRSLLQRRRVESDLDRELRFHLDRLVDENIAQGMPLELARAAAKRRLGGTAQIQEECRDMRRTQQLETIWNDLRYAVRSLRKTPGFATVIVLTLALAIGANSAIFSVIEGVLLRPLPYAQPDRLVRIHFTSDKYPKFPLNPNDLRDFRSRNRSLEGMAGIVRSDVQLSGNTGEPLMLRAFSVTSGYFRVLGFAPQRGREFTEVDELPAQGHQAILSDRLWRTRFASDPGIIGRAIRLDSQSYTVAGVMPPGVQHPGNDYHAIADGDTVDLWLPFTYRGNPNQRDSHFMEAIGRLKPGVSPEQANADLSAVLVQLGTEHANDKNWRVILVPLYRETVGSSERLIMVLLGAVGFLLLIACVNAANLLLARASARVREIAVRSALGAARGRIVRQLLTESLVIAGAAAALGTLLAVGGVRALVASLPSGFPRAAEIRLDSTVFAFTLLVALATGLIFGLVPALTASRTDLQQGLREGGRNTTGGTRQLQLRNFLVAGETGLACVLLIAAGLMLHSFVNLLRNDPGFRPEHVLTASLSLPTEHYRENPKQSHFIDLLVTRLETLSGVESAGAGSDLPWTGYNENIGGFKVEGQPEEFNDKTTARYHMASANFFRTLGTPLIRGRFFTAYDSDKAPQVMVINETMASLYWPGEDAVGKRISFQDNPKEKDWIQVVGVVGDVRDGPDVTKVRPAFWLAAAQNPNNSISVAIRSNSDPSQLANQLRAAVHGLDPDLALDDLRVMDKITGDAVSGQRFALYLVGLFAALALILAAFGLYGVISYTVNQRQHEFGLRMALGAKAWDLVRMVVTQGWILSAIGAAVGLLSAALLTRFLRSLLYGVSETDPITFAAVGALALAMAVLACYVPARRAGASDPMQSLRAE